MGQKSVSIGAKKFLGSLNSIGREWACSRSLSNLTGAREEYESVYTAEIEKLRSARQTKSVIKDYVSLYYFKSSDINEKEYPLLSSLLKAYIKLIFGEPAIKHIDSTGSVYNIPTNNNSNV